MIEQAALACEALGPCAVVRASGTEGMNALPRWVVEVLCADGGVDTEALIGGDATLAFGDDAGGTRSIPLLVTGAFYRGAHRDGFRYGLELSARASQLVLRSGHRVFQDRTTQEIVDEVLKDAGIPAAEIAWRLGGQYQKRVYCVQYGESEWGFVARLLADEGINCWFDHDGDDGPLLVFGDGNGSHASIAQGMTVRYEDASAMSGSAAVLSELSRTFEIAHDSVEIRDYDLRHPDTLIEAKAGEGPLEHYEFPAGVLAKGAEARARVRLEQLQRFMVSAEARSGCARLQPGRVLRIEGAADDALNGDHLIVEVEHAITQASRGEAEAARPYTNRAKMVPFGGERYHRPDLPRAAPRVDGLETATVTGSAGEEIHVDDLGCIKLRFPWDRSGIADDRSSCWVRCLQMSMHGAMLLPRVGWEVPVVYADGDPDRPFALGRLYNGAAPVPYGQPGKRATSTLQSATSPADGTTQEIRLADDAGGMEAFLHATRDQTVSVGGSSTIKVGVDESHDVVKSSVLTVHGAQTTTIAASQTITVGADEGITVKGARSESIGGMETIGVTGSYTMECKGKYGEVVGGLYGLECNQSNTVVQGSFTQTVAGPMAITAGLGTNNSVAAARLEDVGGSRSFTALASYADSVKGAKKITAGASSDTAGTDVVTHVGGVGMIKVGGSASLKAGGPIAVEAPRITIKVGGTLTAKGGGTLKIGGKVETSGGKTKFAADKTQKKSTSKVG